jgi:hypothetical protein
MRKHSKLGTCVRLQLVLQRCATFNLEASRELQHLLIPATIICGQREDLTKRAVSHTTLPANSLGRNQADMLINIKTLSLSCTRHFSIQHPHATQHPLSRLDFKAIAFLRSTAYRTPHLQHVVLVPHLGRRLHRFLSCSSHRRICP